MTLPLALTAPYRNWFRGDDLRPWGLAHGGPVGRDKPRLAPRTCACSCWTAENTGPPGRVCLRGIARRSGATSPPGRSQRGCPSALCALAPETQRLLRPLCTRDPVHGDHGLWRGQGACEHVLLWPSGMKAVASDPGVSRLPVHGGKAPGPSERFAGAGGVHGGQSEDRDSPVCVPSGRLNQTRQAAWLPQRPVASPSRTLHTGDRGVDRSP